MPKLPAPTPLAEPEPRPRFGAARAVALGLLLAPLIYESSLVCAARWRGLLGTEAVAATPVLDALAGSLDACAHWARGAYRPWLRDPAWPASRAIVVALAWAAATITWMARR